jgi:hypothetical protein
LYHTKIKKSSFGAIWREKQYFFSVNSSPRAKTYLEKPKKGFFKNEKTEDFNRVSASFLLFGSKRKRGKRI